MHLRRLSPILARQHVLPMRRAGLVDAVPRRPEGLHHPALIEGPRRAVFVDGGVGCTCGDYKTHCFITCGKACCKCVASGSSTPSTDNEQGTCKVPDGGHAPPPWGRPM